MDLSAGLGRVGSPQKGRFLQPKKGSNTERLFPLPLMRGIIEACWKKCLDAVNARQSFSQLLPDHLDACQGIHRAFGLLFTFVMVHPEGPMAYGSDPT